MQVAAPFEVVEQARTTEQLPHPKLLSSRQERGLSCVKLLTLRRDRSQLGIDPLGLDHVICVQSPRLHCSRVSRGFLASLRAFSSTIRYLDDIEVVAHGIGAERPSQRASRRIGPCFLETWMTSPKTASSEKRTSARKDAVLVSVRDEDVRAATCEDGMMGWVKSCAMRAVQERTLIFVPVGMLFVLAANSCSSPRQSAQSAPPELDARDPTRRGRRSGWTPRRWGRKAECSRLLVVDIHGCERNRIADVIHLVGESIRDCGWFDFVLSKPERFPAGRRRGPARPEANAHLSPHYIQYLTGRIASDSGVQ